MIAPTPWTLHTGLVVYVMKERDQSFWKGTICSTADPTGKVLIEWAGKYEGVPDTALVDASTVYIATKLN
jgi:hypothetical protein